MECNGSPGSRQSASLLPGYEFSRAWACISR